MRYLKYNEGFSEGRESRELVSLQVEVTKIANECLAYLLDDKFDIVTERCGSAISGYYISCGIYYEREKNIGQSPKSFKWETIKNDFIPYIETINSKFIIKDEFSLPIYIQTTEGGYRLSLDNIINDKVRLINEREILYVTFEVKNFRDNRYGDN